MIAKMTKKQDLLSPMPLTPVTDEITEALLNIVR